MINDDTGNNYVDNGEGDSSKKRTFVCEVLSAQLVAIIDKSHAAIVGSSRNNHGLNI